MSYSSKAYLEYEERRHLEHGQAPTYSRRVFKNIPTWLAARIAMDEVRASMTPEEWEEEARQERERFNQQQD